jgi:GntR family transcriptional repressor for pyruvate dehydrogenase complex
VLEAMGVIRTNVGSGPGAGAVVIADPAAPIGSALRWHLASRHLPVADLVGTRVLIESWAVQAAAGNAGAEQLAGATELLRAMENPGLTAEQFLELDTQFHVALAEAAGNGVITAIMQAMRHGIQAYVTEAVSALTDWPAMAERLRAEHAQVLAAVVDGDGPAAGRAVTAHINGFYADTGVG